MVSNVGNHKLTVQEATADRSLWFQSCEVRCLIILLLKSIVL